VADGAWITLIGPNGAGKTSVLRALAGLVGFGGEIDLGTAPVGATPRKKLAQLVAYVPQRPFIPPTTTVTDYVLMGRTPYIPYLGTESRTDLDVVAEVLDRLELNEFGDRELGSLSGGEVQRAVLGRALAQRAPVLLLDEPTSALDVGHQQQVLELVDVLRREASLTVVSTMHDLTLAGQYADDLLLLSNGRSIARGSASEVLREDLIRQHYGASVKVIRDESGLLVVPTRENA
ncbi:MAG TPA: ABC transporter ATP-binding protein, partial [Actinomycetota bacterium]|nr:ABC transporter ATP-binding protein [Actinomycetota bacterium]